MTKTQIKEPGEHNPMQAAEYLYRLAAALLLSHAEGVRGTISVDVKLVVTFPGPVAGDSDPAPEGE